MAKRILLVEDESLTRNIISVFLRHEGYEVHEAKDGAEALDLLHIWRFDLVLSDIRLPRVDGIAVGSHLRSVAPNTPFIAITAYPDDAVGLSAIPKATYMSKPILLDQLKFRIQRLLN